MRYLPRIVLLIVLVIFFLLVGIILRQTNANVPTLPTVSSPLSVATLASQAHLARTKAVQITDITVVSVVAVDWPDTSLGCPQEGLLYAQVITPGFMVLLSHDGKQYTYHTDQAENASEVRAVDCTDHPNPHPGLLREAS